MNYSIIYYPNTFRTLNDYERLMVHGSRLKAHGSWPRKNWRDVTLATGRRADFFLAMSHVPWALSHATWALSQKPRAMSHEPCTMCQEAWTTHHRESIDWLNDHWIEIHYLICFALSISRAFDVLTSGTCFSEKKTRWLKTENLEHRPIMETNETRRGKWVRSVKVVPSISVTEDYLQEDMICQYW